jgi:hypothetical protein
LVTFVDFHKIFHHHGIGLQDSPLFFCTWHNFSDLFGFGGHCYGGEGIGESSITQTSISSITQTSISSMGVTSMGIGIASIASVGVGGVGTIVVVPVRGDGHGGNSWGSDNGGNIVNGGNGEGDFASCVGIKDLLEIGFSLSNIG